MAFALVESGKITKLINGNKGIKIGDIQYPSSFFTTVYSEAERNAAGVYTIELDSTNRKDETFYINTNVTYTFTGSAVTGSYGTATAKELADKDAVDESGNKLKDDKGNQIVIYGLKTKYKNQFNAEAAGLLAKTDWYVIKAADVTSYSVPSNITTYRAAVRTKVNSMETQIDGCSDVDALITLLTYTTDSEGVQSRPLGEFPDEVV